MRSRCFFLNSISSGNRAIVPSSCKISQRTPGRLQPGEPRKIDRCFGMSGPAQNAAVFCAQRENVARLHEIRRRRFRIGNLLNRRCTVVRADSSGDAFRCVH